MTPVVEKFLNDFDHLSEDEQQLAWTEILKRMPDYTMEPVTEEELDAVAAELFQALDREEEGKGD